ncbi:DNA polymerase III subunit beta [bacterium]|nr:DNA polymerase III subunit beta [bacterium]
MQLEVSTQALSKLLSLTTTIVEKRNTMPILANVKLTAQDSNLQVTATDLEVSFQGSAEATIKTPGSITVNARFLFEIVRELPAPTVTLKAQKGERLEIESGASHFKINGISSDEFPSIMGTNAKTLFSLDANGIVQAIDKTIYAVSSDETRYNLTGVFLETVDSDKTLRFVATDGHRLAVVDRPSQGMTSPKKGVIVPRKGILELKKILEGNEGACQLGLDEGFLTVKSGNLTLGIRLIDGEFPDYRQVIPNEVKTTIKVAKEDFLAAVRRTSLVTTDKSKSLRVKLAQGQMSFTSQSSEFGEAEESIPVEIDGEEISVAFSARYLMEMLTAMGKTESVTAKLNGEWGPGVFATDSGEDYTCVIMPMRFDAE